MADFWRRIVDKADAFPPEFWHLFLQLNFTALDEKCRPVCVGMEEVRRRRGHATMAAPV